MPRRNALRYAGLGVELAAALLLGVFAGRWADQRFHGGGIFSIAGAFLGFAAVLYGLLRSLEDHER